MMIGLTADPFLVPVYLERMHSNFLRMRKTIEVMMGFPALKEWRLTATDI